MKRVKRSHSNCVRRFRRASMAWGLPFTNLAFTSVVLSSPCACTPHGERVGTGGCGNSEQPCLLSLLQTGGFEGSRGPVHAEQ